MPSARTGRFGAGLTWAEFDAATQAHGLAVTGGRVSHTGIAGLTLGSGSGWLERVLRNDLREPPLRRGRDRGRPHAARQRGRERRAVLGAQGRRRQLRRRDRVRVPAAPGRPARLRGNDPAPARGRPRAAALLPRLHGRRAPDEVCGGFALLTAPPADFIPEPARGTARRGTDRALRRRSRRGRRASCGRCWSGATRG